MRTKKRLLTTCQVCKHQFFEEDLGDGVWFNYGEPIYSYRGFDCCEGCLDTLREKVNDKRERIIEAHNSKSLAAQNVEHLPPEHPFHEVSKKMLSRQIEIASKPVLEEEEEYRKGKL